MEFLQWGLHRHIGSNVILLVIALNLLGFSFVNGSMEMGNLKRCKGIDLDLLENNVMDVQLCLQDGGVKEIMDMDISQIACVGKCMMVKKGIVDGNGLPDKNVIRKLIADDLPSIVHEEFNKEVDECLNNESRLIDPADESCTTYIPLGLCLQNAFIEVCQ